MEVIIWTSRGKNEEMLHRATEEITHHAVKGRKVKSIRHILRMNCLLKHVTEEKLVKKRREKEEEKASRYFINLRKRENTGI
jgi:hypothetical protein